MPNLISNDSLWIASSKTPSGNNHLLSYIYLSNLDLETDDKFTIHYFHQYNCRTYKFVNREINLSK